MIYLIGGAPRTGKSILAQRLAAQLRIEWISTDLLEHMLQFNHVEGIKTEWNAAPEAITAAAEWFFPSLEHFVWGIHSMSEGYVIEGVDFLPEHVVRLSAHYPLRSVFLGCSKMTLEQFDQFPGRSPGYAFLPEEMRRRFAQDIPLWSEFIRQEAGRCGCSYIDMSGDFQSRQGEAESFLITGIFPPQA